MDLHCVWEPFEGQVRCKDCGKVRKRAIRANCPTKLNPQIPTITQRVKNLGKAAARHIVTGRRHCTDEEKQERFNKCQSNVCGRFIVHGPGGICAHEDCGCYIRSNGRFLDKLSWADSECPEGYWGPITEKDEETPENGV